MPALLGLNLGSDPSKLYISPCVCNSTSQCLCFLLFKVKVTTFPLHRAVGRLKRTNAVLLKLQCTYESPGSLGNLWILVARARVKPDVQYAGYVDQGLTWSDFSIMVDYDHLMIR